MSSEQARHLAQQGAASLTVGILTFHTGTNHGGFLQALFLQKFLISLGFKVRILNYANRGAFIRERLGFILNRRLDLVRFNLVKTLTFRRARQRLLLFPKKMILSSRKLSKLSENLDFVVVGSDIVWARTMQELGSLDAYFGIGLKPRVGKISYAASAGPSTNLQLPPLLTDSLSEFLALGVRDPNTFDALRLEGLHPTLVADPTFLVNVEEALPFHDEATRDDRAQYVVVYASPLSSATLEMIRLWSSKRGLDVRIIGYPQDGFLTSRTIVEPESWLTHIRGARYVFTNSYHGTIFSILLRTPFFTIGRPAIKNKVLPLLELLGLEVRYSDSEDDFTIADVGIDWDSVEAALRPFQQHSRRFLTEAFGL